MYINTFKFTPADVACKFCTKYIKKRGCTAHPCPWLAERIEAGVVGYKDVILGTFSRDSRLTSRLQPLIWLFPGSLWHDDWHRRRMDRSKTRLGYRRSRDTPAFYAALYLLTSNADIYGRTTNCFCKHGVEFEYMILRGISPHDYTLLAAARSIYAGFDSLTVNDLADPEIVDSEAFRLIVHALLIARYGPAVLGLRGKSMRHSDNSVTWGNR